MNLKRAILEAMGRDALKDAIVQLDLADGVDRRIPDAMRSRLARARRATPEALLPRLRVADVRRVCELQGVDATARKQVLVERLLDGNAKPRSRKPPSASKDFHAAGRGPRAADDGTPEPPSKTRKRQAKSSTAGNGVTTGYETELWAAANALRGNMDAAEYKHVVLGLIFLKYISDAFEERHARLEAERDEGADPEDPDFYIGANVFWVPPEARWRHLRALAKQPAIGKAVDDAMVAVERNNRSLRDVLPKDYARPSLDKRRLGELIDLVGKTSRWAMRTPAPETCWAAFTNTSSALLPARRASGAESSTRHVAS